MADDLGTTEREIIAQRTKKAEALRALGVNPFGNGHAPRHVTADLVAEYGDEPADAIATHAGDWSLAGRVLAVRSFGKAAFLRLRDRAGDVLPEADAVPARQLDDPAAVETQSEEIKQHYSRIFRV